MSKAGNFAKATCIVLTGVVACAVVIMLALLAKVSVKLVAILLAAAMPVAIIVLAIWLVYRYLEMH